MTAATEDLHGIYVNKIKRKWWQFKERGLQIGQLLNDSLCGSNFSLSW